MNIVMPGDPTRACRGHCKNNIVLPLDKEAIMKSWLPLHPRHIKDQYTGPIHRDSSDTTIHFL